MTIPRLILATMLSLFLFLTGAAQETQAPPSAGPEQGAEPPAQPPAPESEEPRTLEQIFIPSEEIAADEEVTFPINI